MVKSTSIEARDEVRQLGQDNIQAKIIWNFLYSNPRSTRKEVAQATGISINAATGRISEMLNGDYPGLYLYVSGKEEKGELGTMVEVLSASNSLVTKPQNKTLTPTEMNNLEKKLARANIFQARRLMVILERIINEKV